LFSGSAGKHNEVKFKMRKKEDVFKFVLFCFYTIYSRKILLNIGSLSEKKKINLD